MNRSIGMERVYSLGDYKSLRVSDYANEIPEELALNDEFINSFKALQLVSADKLYYSYALMAGELSELESDQARVDYLDEKETKLYAKLVDLMIQKISE